MKFCSLASGSNGNCQYVGSGKSGLLIDAGLSGKYIKGSLESLDVDFESIKGILITHEHGDHIKGAGIVARKLKIPIFGTEETLEAASKSIKLDNVELIRIKKNCIYNINGEEVSGVHEEEELYFKAFGISHDSADPVGYSVLCNEIKMSTVTDIGVVSDEVIEEVKTSDFILLEANHDVEMLKMGSYPFYLKKRILSDIGHLSNEAAATAAAKIIESCKTKGILLGHLSKENNFPELAYETVAAKLREFGIEPDIDIKLEMAFRDKASNFFVFE